MTLTFGSLFAGIGGIDLGLERAGMTCKWQVEIDPFCQKVLQKHWPNVARYEDVRTVGKHNLEPVDLIAGGFPCQDVSLAGLQAGMEGERSSLWKEYARIIGEIKPRWIVAENVRGLLSSNDGRFFGEVLRDLADRGYDAEWDCLPASAFGAPHQRERIFIVAYPNQKHGGTRMGIQRKKQTEIFSIPPEKRADVWSKAPPIGIRVDDGLSPEFYRRAAGSYGNAVVPQVAEWIGRRIIEQS
jgi:DNA (cytosine-5)-methyltransferase 1